MRSKLDWRVVGLALALILGSAAVYLAFGGGPKWGPYTSDGGRFRVRMFGTPKPQGQAVGAATAWTHKVEPAPGVEYEVTYLDLPTEMTAPDKVEKTLTDACYSLANKAGGKASDEKPLTLGATPGREVRIDGPGGQARRVRFYLAGTRFYQVTVSGSAAAVAEPTADAFLDSFTIL